MKRKHFDKEYSSTFLEEVKFLKLNGIEPSYIKKVDDTIIYKFTKTSILFKTLAKFY